ncbi:hypothetical protein RvY_17104-1 [Ramazzottius varieornatus]|uniref:Uncharacterized protein n=1 Tax=Ramazzottius varieornatus TaxID=947166 RepID=A0A1D1W0Y1_RAMVA|nr:hypothetical protein RvY_17104-1 [Ramazzottius varieornatus]
MAEEMHTKKYIAFSEDALSEQVARLQEICSQQASAIQNLTTSILQMSKELASRPGHSSSTSGQHNKHQTPAKSHMANSAPSHSKKGPSASASHQQKRPSHQPTPSHSKMSSNSAKRVKVENVTHSMHSDEVEKAPESAAVDFDRSQDARATFLGYLTDLRDHYQFEVRSQVVRANLCQGWIAVRPEELLARLRMCGQEAPTRKEFMDIVLSLGPEITRGRSVKFGRDTRRALAIPRKYFTPAELAVLDQAYTKNGEDMMDDGEEEQEHEMGDTDGEGQEEV